jgi:solute carrier family 45 protein 1/2/4
VQAGIRAFIVDNCPAHQQELANAWASRLTGVGNILGYIFGYSDLPKILPFLGNTQFKILCALASISLIATLALSCSYIRERDPRLDGPPPSDGLGLISFFEQAFRSVRNLPPQIARVCEVQIAAWVGWFPFLFYSTTYIGQLYANPIFAEHPDLPDDQIDKTWEDATRVGTFALLIYAIISFIANIILPLFVVPTYDSKEPVARHEHASETQFEEEEEPAPRRLSFSGMPTGTAEEPLLDAISRKSVDSGKPTRLSRLQIPGLTLRRTWLLSHILFALCMFSTFFISYYPAGSIVIGFVGISWAVTLWAPFALISAEVSRIELQRRLNRHRTMHAEGSASQRNTSGSYAPVSAEDDHENQGGGENDLEQGTQREAEHLVQAGIVLGIHNVAVSFPQIFSSLACSAIFKVAQKPRGAPWDDSVGWVLRFGGCAALVAAWLTRRLAEGSH